MGDRTRALRIVGISAALLGALAACTNDDDGAAEAGNTHGNGGGGGTGDGGGDGGSGGGGGVPLGDARSEPLPPPMSVPGFFDTCGGKIVSGTSRPHVGEVRVAQGVVQRLVHRPEPLGSRDRVGACHGNRGPHVPART
jgi:hypothetical protein